MDLPERALPRSAQLGELCDAQRPPARSHDAQEVHPVCLLHAPKWAGALCSPTRPFVLGRGAGRGLLRALVRSGAGGEPYTSFPPPAPPGCSGEVHSVAAALCAAGTWRRFRARPVPDSGAGGRQLCALPRPTHGGEPGTARRSLRPPCGPGEGRPRSHVRTLPTAPMRNRPQATNSTWLSVRFAHELDSRVPGEISTGRCDTCCNYVINSCRHRL